MASPEAITVAESTVDLGLSHAHAPPLDVLNLVMRGREGQTLDFSYPRARHGSLADSASPFGQIVAAALDGGMDPPDWIDFTSDRAHAGMRATLLQIWRDDILGARFAKRYGVTVKGAPSA